MGSSFVNHVLSQYGYVDVAYDLLLQDTCPSWLYPVTQGATTVWERWDGQRPDGSFQTPEMNSFNHYAYGAIGEWIYKVVAGLSVDEDNPGYKHIIINPQPGGGLTYARLTYDSIRGEIVCGWELKEPGWVLEVEIPANTTATVHFPANTLDQIDETDGTLSESTGILSVNVGATETLVEIGSGRYQFTVSLQP